MTMSLPTKVVNNLLQAYQIILYPRALHPELFQLKARRVLRHGGYELEAWVMPGTHVLRFEYAGFCASELLTDQESNLPEQGAITRLLCAGEHDFEHRFEAQPATYMTSVQTETLSENLYLATYRELVDFAAETGAVLHRWRDEAGPCLSMIDMQAYAREAHAQSYHMVAAGGLVLRTQTLFEHC